MSQIEVSEQTKKELEAEEQKKFFEWNKKINDLANEVIEALKEEQLTLHDFTEVLKIAQTKMGEELGKLNLNYISNNVSADKKLNNNDKKL